MRVEKEKKRVFITSENKKNKEEIELVVNDWKIILNWDFSVQELLDWLRELWHYQSFHTSLTNGKYFPINDCSNKPLSIETLKLNNN